MSEPGFMGLMDGWETVPEWPDCSDIVVECSGYCLGIVWILSGYAHTAGVKRVP